MNVAFLYIFEIIKYLVEVAMLFRGTLLYTVSRVSELNGEKCIR